MGADGRVQKPLLHGPDGSGPKRQPKANVRSERDLTLQLNVANNEAVCTVDKNGHEIAFVFLNRPQDNLVEFVIDSLKAFGAGALDFRLIGEGGIEHHLEAFEKHGEVAKPSLYDSLPFVTPPDGPRTA